MADLRTMTLKLLEQEPLDIFAIRENLNVDFERLAKELSTLLEADYISKNNSLFYLTDRGRQYLKVEPR